MNLRADIEAAFSGVSPPDAQAVVSPTYDDEGVIALFRGKRWRDLTIDELRTHIHALSFFSPEAFHYFLPAFLLAELTDPIAAGQIGPTLLFHFSRPESFFQDEFRRRLGLLNPAQREVIARFVRNRGAVCGYTDAETEEIAKVVFNGI